MTEQKKHEFKERLKVLLEKYCRQLPEKYSEIEQSWQEYQSDLSNPSHIELFYRLIHTLKGTAATFNFTVQADICLEIQKMLLKVKEDSSVLEKNDVVKIQKYIEELKANINAPAQELPG